MAHIMHFMKTGCTSTISQTSGFQKYLLKNLTCIFLSIRANSENTFAMTDPVLKSIHCKKNCSNPGPI